MGQVPFIDPPLLISTHFHPISSGSALKWHNITKGLAVETYLLYFNCQTLQKDFQNFSEKWSVQFCFKVISCHMDALSVLKGHVQWYWKIRPHTPIWVTPLIRASYSNMGSTTHTLIWVTLLILWYGLHYSALLSWARQCYNMRTPINWNANQCVVSCWYQYHLSLAKSKKLENYFESIVCEILKS